MLPVMRDTMLLLLPLKMPLVDCERYQLAQLEKEKKVSKLSLCLSSTTLLALMLSSLTCFKPIMIDFLLLLTPLY